MILRALTAVLVVTTAFAAAGCGGSGASPSTSSHDVVARHATGRAVRFESVGVTLTPAPVGYRPPVSRRAVLALRRQAGMTNGYATGKPAVRLRTVNGAYPAWVITFRHPYCTAVSIYDLRARIWTWNFANCLHRTGPATCEGECTPANQPALDAAASYAERVAGAAHVLGGVEVDDDTNSVVLHLVRAPKAVLEELRARHPGVYVIHNDAPRTLRAVMTIAHEIHPRALEAKGIDVVQWGPTQDGHLQVGVSSNVAKAQAFFDAKYGRGILRVVHAEPAVAS